MKRGLKDRTGSAPSLYEYVATIAPMKRGLKVNGRVPDLTVSEVPSCSNHCPDEKGTESLESPLISFINYLSSNHCPDEKGTESDSLLKVVSPAIIVATIAPMKRGLKGHDIKCSSRLSRVATIAPMKRGLKADRTLARRLNILVATIAPMKRGLKETAGRVHRSITVRK